MALRQAVFRPFSLAFIQLGQIGANKADNLKHAREMIFKAILAQGRNKKPDIVVLPVRLLSASNLSYRCLIVIFRNVSTPLMVTFTSLSMPRSLGLHQGSLTTLLPLQVKV
jgi:hypothetical protein